MSDVRIASNDGSSPLPPFVPICAKSLAQCISVRKGVLSERVSYLFAGQRVAVASISSRTGVDSVFSQCFTRRPRRVTAFAVTAIGILLLSTCS
jgi:hypothetical protein